MHLLFRLICASIQQVKFNINLLNKISCSRCMVDLHPLVFRDLVLSSIMSTIFVRSYVMPFNRTWRGFTRSLTTVLFASSIHQPQLTNWATWERNVSFNCMLQNSITEPLLISDLQGHVFVKWWLSIKTVSSQTSSHPSFVIIASVGKR